MDQITGRSRCSSRRQVEHDLAISNASARITLRLVRAIQAVLFDFHATLIDMGDAQVWIRAAERDYGGPVPDPHRGQLVGFLDRIWERANDYDPGNERDISAARHRDIFESVIGRSFPTFDRQLVDALYLNLLAAWVAYDDAIPVLKSLQRLGIRTAIVSNAGIDIRPVITRTGLADHLDSVVVSGEIGAVKPQPEIFERALAALGVAARDTLMVGDNPLDDVGAVYLGVRTLLLPRTRGPVHGLDAVLALVGAPPLS